MVDFITTCEQDLTYLVDLILAEQSRLIRSPMDDGYQSTLDTGGVLFVTKLLAAVQSAGSDSLNSVFAGRIFFNLVQHGKSIAESVA